MPKPTHFSAAALAAALSLFAVARAQPHASAQVPAPQSATAARASSQSPAARPSAAVRATLGGHTRDIISLAFSPDGRLLATGDERGVVHVWDTATGGAVSNFRLTDGADDLRLFWSPGGRALLTDWREGLDAGRPQIWDARAGLLVLTLAGHAFGANSAEWSPDGRAVVTAGDDGRALIWDAETGERRTEIVYEKIDTSKYTDSLIKDLFTKKKLRDYFGITARFAAGGRTVLVDSNGHPPRLYSAADGRELAALLTPAQMLAPRYASRPYYERARLAPGGGRVVATNSPEGVELWDAATGGWLRRLAESAGPPEFTPDGRAVLAGWSKSPYKFFDSESSIIKLWDVETGDVLRTYEKLPGAVQTFWSPDGATVVRSGTGKSRPRLLDLKTGRVVAKLPYDGCTSDSWFGGEDCEPFVFSADSRLTLKLKDTLKLFDARTGRLVATLEDTNRRALFHPTDPRLLAARSKGKRSIILYELSHE